MISRFLRIWNLEIRRISQERIDGSSYPDWRSALYQARNLQDTLFEVPLERCVDALGYYFSRQENRSFHPYSQAISEILGSAPPEYSASSLKRYYQSNQPATGADLFPEEQLLRTSPPDTHLVPWLPSHQERTFDRRTRRLTREYDTIAAPGNPLFGPMNDDQGQVEYDRLKAIAGSIAREGFRQPQRRADHIQGILLRRDDDVRFVVMAGKHRVAALGVIAPESTVPVRLRRANPIEERDVDAWPMVISGEWRRSSALAYFDRLFHGTGVFER